MSCANERPGAHITQYPTVAVPPRNARGFGEPTIEAAEKEARIAKGKGGGEEAEGDEVVGEVDQMCP